MTATAGTDLTQALQEQEEEDESFLELPGLRRAAIAILLLGDDLARELFRLFKADDVRRLLAVANNLRGVTEEEVLDVLQELVRELEQGVPGISGHGHRIEAAAVSVFGADLIRAVSSKEVAGLAMQIHNVATEKPEAFAKTLEKEHPQTIAIVLAMLPAEVGGNVLRYFAKPMKTDVVRRVAHLRSVPSAVLAGVTETVGREFGPVDDQGPITIDGIDMAVKLLKSIGAADEQRILDGIAEKDADMAETIKNKLFVFEDISQLHDREVQLVMREIDQRTVPLALKTASEEVQNKLLGNISSRAAQMLRDDMSALGPVTVSQVEEAQNQILAQITALAAEGKINLRPGDTV